MSGFQEHICVPYAANSIACAVAVASIEVLFEENLIENAEKMGKIVEQEFSTYNHPFIHKKHCGKGLYTSLEFKDVPSCSAVCKYMLDNGVLVFPDSRFLRVMPPLCITEEELRKSLKILKAGLDEYDKVRNSDLLI